jgi:hypothetical protein
MSLRSELVLGVIALAIVALALLGRRAVDSRSLALFRVLLPSWRFFEDIAPTPRLWCRVATHGDEFGPWRELLQGPTRHAVALLLNPTGNLHLACHAALEQLQSELEEAPSDARVGDLIGYGLVANIVAYELRAAQGAGPHVRFQFRLADGDRELVMSDTLEVGV